MDGIEAWWIVGGAVLAGLQSRHKQPTVYMYHLPGDIAGRRRAEESRGMGDVVDAAQARERDLLKKALPDPFGENPGHLRIDHSGRDGIYRDPIFRQLSCRYLCEGHHPGFGRCITGLTKDPQPCRHRRDVYDAPSRPQNRRSLADATENTGEIDPQYLVPF